MCAQHLAGGPLVCVRTDDHDTHVFHASWHADKHDRTEASGDDQ